MIATPAAIQSLARQLLAVDTARAGANSRDVDRAMWACEKLRGPLTKLTGPTAFTSLASRALALARRRSPLLEGLRIGSDGALQLSEEMPQPVAATETDQDVAFILLVELLGLLVALIGEPLTLGLVREAWADVSIATVTLRTEEQA